LQAPSLQLSVIIVSYNVAPFLLQTIETLERALQGIQAEVWVVDNASADDSVSLVRKHFPSVKVIANTQNTGFSKANNQAIKESTGEYILLLNPDIILAENTLQICLDYMQANEHVGGLGVHMLDGAGRYLPESKRGLPTPWVAFSKVFGLTGLFPNSQLFARYYLGHLDESHNQEVEILSGAFMLMRSSALETSGLLDETFFMYGEDIDLSYRLLLTGYKNVMLADTRIIHYKGESTKRGSANYVRIFYKAMIIFADKHFSKSYAGVLSYFINVAIYLRAGFAILQRWFRMGIVPAIDAGLIFAGMYFLKEYWERNHKGVPNYYPVDFIQIVVPAYIFTWLVAVYYSGGYDKPSRPSAVSRGIIVGTILIAAITNFFDNYRFSKALILMGGTWAIFSMMGWRTLMHLLKFNNLAVGVAPSQRVVVMGSWHDAKNAQDILIKNGQGSQFLGYLSNNVDNNNKYFLGTFSELLKCLKLYQATELIFCLGSVHTEMAINIMENLRDREITFRTLPKSIDLLIGSKTKGEQGDWYSTEDKLEISSATAKRAKRLLDIALSIVLLTASPLLIWVQKSKSNYIKNIGRVLLGNKSWVGVKKGIHKETDKLRAGVLQAHSLVSQDELATETERRLHYLYARDYSLTHDIKIVLKNLRKLGS